MSAAAVVRNATRRKWNSGPARTTTGRWNLATDDTVLGDFNNVEFTQHGLTSRMYRDGKKFMIRTEGPDGQLADFEIKYTFGIRPLQQYMVEFDRPADMPAARDCAAAGAADLVGHGEEAMDRCAAARTCRNNSVRMIPCTGPASPSAGTTCVPTATRRICRRTTTWRRRTYHTTFSEIDVSCEACHGPASVHVRTGPEQFVVLGSQTRATDWRDSRRCRLATADRLVRAVPFAAAECCYADFRPGDHYHDYFDNELLEESTYYADGQIMDEDYEYGSFLQSKMYHKDIRCSDCHNPHSIRLKQDGNEVCTACHQHPAAKYDTPAHHFHKSDSTGASCAECHMPETTYMEVDPRRDHSIRIPRPDLSVALGTPNACTRCHLSDAKISDEKRATLPAISRLDRRRARAVTRRSRRNWHGSTSGCSSRCRSGTKRRPGATASPMRWTAGRQRARRCGSRPWRTWRAIASCRRSCGRRRFTSAALLAVGRQPAAGSAGAGRRRSAGPQGGGHVVSTSTFRPWPAGRSARQEEQQLSEQVAPLRPAAGAAAGRSAAERPRGNRTRAGPAARAAGRGAAQREPAREARPGDRGIYCRGAGVE